jgi:hypothetical protein
MSEFSSAHFVARDGAEFHRRIAVFAYASYTEDGRGCVLLHQNQFTRHRDGKIEATVVYAPATEANALPPECRDRIAAYDPSVECVFATIDPTNQALVITLGAREIGTTPKRLYEAAMLQDRHVPFVAGSVLMLRDSACGLAPGYYVFIEERKAHMVLRRVEEDAEGELVGGNVTHRVHVDFRDAFKGTGVKVATGRE